MKPRETKVMILLGNSREAQNLQGGGRQAEKIEVDRRGGKTRKKKIIMLVRTTYRVPLEDHAMRLTPTRHRSRAPSFGPKKTLTIGKANAISGTLQGPQATLLHHDRLLLSRGPFRYSSSFSCIYPTPPSAFSSQRVGSTWRYLQQGSECSVGIHEWPAPAENVCCHAHLCPT